MPARRRNDNSVRGPNSALTAFLREQGINASEIRERHERRLNNIPLSDDEVNSVSEDELEEEELMRSLAREKRRRLNDDDDDDEEDFTPRNTLPGEFINCIECNEKFKVTVYTKNFFKNGVKGYLCDNCNELNKIKLKKLKKTQLKLRKKRQLMAKSLLDKKEFNIPSLQDSCIKLISSNIDHVENLGDIGSVNYNKLSRILSKNRSLNDKTVSLFLISNLTSIEFWDCSNIDYITYDKMIAYCPNLTKVTLSMCGQFNNGNLLNLPNLSKLEELNLDGPFLVNEQTWQDFFVIMGERLKGFKINNTHRFNDECLQSLISNCMNLQQISLKRLDGLINSLSYELIPHYLKQLQSLEISYPNAQILDDTILNILQENELETLILENCVYLTDFWLNGLLTNGSKIQNLTIASGNNTEDGFNQIFSNWTNNSGLLELSLYNNINIQLDSLLALLNHSKNSLIKLNINSCKSLSLEFWSKLPKMPLLTILDCGFVRSFDNIALKRLLKLCENLTILEIYGNNKCNDVELGRKGLKIIGREIDSI